MPSIWPPVAGPMRLRSPHHRAGSGPRGRRPVGRRPEFVRRLPRPSPGTGILRRQEVGRSRHGAHRSEPGHLVGRTGALTCSSGAVCAAATSSSRCASTTTGLVAKVAGVAIRRSERSLPEWFGRCAGADDRGVGAGHAIDCRGLTRQHHGLQLSKFSPNCLSLRAVERNVEQDFQLAGSSTPWKCLDRLQQERHRILRNTEVRPTGSKHARRATDTLLSIVIIESAKTAVFECKKRVRVYGCPRHICATDQGSTTSTLIPSKSRTFRVTRAAPRERQMAAIGQSASPIGRPARRRSGAISA